MTKIELLAPAGSYAMMKAAFRAGADAVYIGGEKFGARAYADNLNCDELISAIDYAHLRGKRIYLTVNTLLKDKEINEELCQYLRPFYERGLDAVIVQDVGVMSLIRTTFPDLPIHASTQMAITGSASAKLLKKAGASRIILPRELSLNEITQIKNEAEVELESFIHGALCYSYSGQCLFSSYLGGRSGNRGRCAGTCRLPYSVLGEGKLLNSKDEQYLLSPKDICAISLLPEIITSGVTSLKIEGRMKKVEYAAGVVRIYRKYLDILADEKATYKVDDNDYQELMDLYNRDGFSQGYYQCHNGKKMMAMKNEKVSFSGKSMPPVRNEALITKLQEAYINAEDALAITGRAIFRVGKEACLMLKYGLISITIKHGEVQSASKQPLSNDRIKAQLNKTGDSSFTFSELEIDADDNIFIAIKMLNELRRLALVKLEEQILSTFLRVDKKARQSHQIALTTKNHTNKAKVDMSDKENVTDSLECILTAQVETMEQLKALYDASDISAIYASVNIFNKGAFSESVKRYIGHMQKAGKKAYLSLPYVLRDNNDLTIFKHFNSFVDMGLSGFLAHNIEGYARLAKWGLHDKVVCDYQIYTLNSYARDFWQTKDILYDTVSPELNYHEIKAMDNKNSEMIIYGYAPIMISAQCVKKNVGKCSGDFSKVELVDRYNKKFVVKCDCDFCYNIIYNSIALGLLKEYRQVQELGCHSLRLAFSIESANETKAIAKAFGDTYKRYQEPTWQQSFTKGHFKRGIE